MLASQWERSGSKLWRSKGASTSLDAPLLRHSGILERGRLPDLDRFVIILPPIAQSSVWASGGPRKMQINHNKSRIIGGDVSDIFQLGIMY